MLMYSNDIKNNRILTYTGKTAYSAFNAAKYYLKHGSFPDGKIVDRGEINNFQQLNPGHKLKFIDLMEEVPEVMDSSVSELEEMKFLDRISRMPRYEDTEVCNERLIKEFDFFSKNDFISVLIALESLIEEFKERGIVWGSGRGSSCASYVLYLMEVHDVNPVQFEIDFSEMSKEYDN